MPTGYTAKVYDGTEESFESFVLRCAHAIEYFIDMRDEPLNIKIKDVKKVDSSYHLNALKKEKKELYRLKKLTNEQIKEEVNKYNEKQMKDWIASCKREKVLRERYEVMLEKVKKWKVPSIEHEGLKNFMIQQLSESIQFDCHHESQKPEDVSQKDWYSNLIEMSEENIKYYLEKLKEEVENVKKRNEYVKLLKESLERNKK